jgi:hypothetical protein
VALLATDASDDKGNRPSEYNSKNIVFDLSFLIEFDLLDSEYDVLQIWYSRNPAW